MAIHLFEQTTLIPQKGGTFLYKYSADGVIDDNYTQLTIQGSASKSEDFTNRQFTLGFSSNTTGSDRTVTGTLSLRVDGETETLNFTVTQTAGANYAYPDDASQITEIPAAGGNASFVLLTNETSSTGFTVTGSEVNRTTGIITSKPVTNYSFTPHYDVKHYSSVSDFRTASLNGEIQRGDWVYVDGVVKGNTIHYFQDGMTYASPGSVTLDDGFGDSSYYRIVPRSLYNLGNVPFTSSNYNDALNATTIGFKYIFTWGATSFKYEIDSSDVWDEDHNIYNDPFIYTANGTSVDPGRRHNITPPSPTSSQDGFTVSVALGENNEGSKVDNWVTVDTGSIEASKSIAQTAKPGSLSLQKTSLNLPGDRDYYYVTVICSNIDFENITAVRTGSGNITPRIVKNGGNIFLRIEIPTSNIGGSAPQTGTITVTGVDGLGTSHSATCDVTVNTDTTGVSVYPQGSSIDPIIVDWQGETLSFALTCTNIASLDRVWQQKIPGGETSTLEYTTESTSSGYRVYVTIPQNTEFADQDSYIHFNTTSSYDLLQPSTFSVIRQESIPPGTITFSDSDPLYLHSYLKTQYVYYTTEWMDDSSITPTVTGDMINPNTLVWNTSGKYVRFDVIANNTGSERQATLTLTGTDQWGIERTASLALIQVPASEDSYIRLVSIHTGSTYPYTNAVITGTFWSTGVDSFQLNSSRSNFIQSLTVTPTSTNNKYDFEATLNTNSTESPITSNLRFSGANTVQDSHFESTIYETANHQITQKCQPGVISATANSIQLSPTGGTVNNYTYSTSRISGAVTASMSGDINGSVTLNGNRIVITYSANATDNDLTGAITLTGTDYNGDEITKTISLSQPKNFEITITPSTATLNYGVNSVSYNVVLDNITNPQVSFSGDTSFIDVATLNNGVLTVNTTDFSAKTAKTANIIVTGTTPSGGTYSKSVTLIKNGTDGEIIVTPDTYNIRKSASDLEFTYELDGVSGNISITTSGDIDFGTVTTSGTTVTIPYGTNDTGSELTGTITLTGTDYKGKTITKDVTVTQTITDGWIKVSPSNQIIETTEQNYATLTVTTSSATFTNVEFSGYISHIRSYTRDGNTITVYLEPITVAGTFYITATVKGVSTDGVNVSDTATITLYGVDGYIMISGSEGSYHIYRNRDSHTAQSIFSCFGVNITDVSSDSNWLRITSVSGDGDLPGVYDSFVKVGIAIDEYAGTPTDWDTNRVGKVIATGVDYKGNTVTAEYVVTQYAVDAEMTVAPTETTIEYNEYLDIDVDLVGAAPVPEITVTPLSIGETFTYEWLDEWDDDFLRSNTVRIYLPTNNTYVDRQYTIIFKCEPPYLGATIWRYVYVTQKAKPASITLSPSSYLADKNSGTVVFNITVDGVDQSRLVTRSYPRWITSASFNSDKTRLTVTYSNNPDVETRVGDICVTESTGIIIGCATITQTGVDPEINVRDLIIRYNEGVSNHFIETKGVGDLTISFSGDVLITDYGMTPTTGGYNLIVQTPDNLTYNILRSTATVTGTVNAGQYLGQTLTKSFAVIKNAKDGVILINPTTQYVRKAGGVVTFNVTCGNMDMSTVTTNAGSFNADKTVLTINVGENTNSTSRTININLSGVDNNGGTRTASASIIQYGTDPSIEVGNIGIPNTQRVTTVFVGTNWVDNLSVTFSGDVVIEDYSLTPTVGGYELSITTPDNLEDAPIYSTALFTGSVTTEPGETVTKQVQVIKYGKEGIINANPTSFILKKAGGTVTVNLLYANMDMSTVTASLGTFNADKSQLTYTVAENPNATDRTITITITGTDVNGITRTATITITQYGIDPYISITPSSKTLRNTESTATFSVTAYKVSDLTVSFNGGLEIINYSLVNGTLTVDTAANEELLSIMEIITISGVSENGETVTATANIIKFGTGGGLIIDPEFTVAGGNYNTVDSGILIVPYYTDRIRENSVYAFINGEMNIEEISVNREGKFVVIEYWGNEDSVNKVSTLTLTGIDEDDIPRTARSTITQLSNNYRLNIKPPYRWLEATSGSTTETLESSNMSAIATYGIDGNMDATLSYDGTFSGSITVAYDANTDDCSKYSYVTITAVSDSGDTVVINDYLIQKGQDYSDYRFIYLDEDQTTGYADGGGKKQYYDIISAIESSGDPVGYYVSGFNLIGYWGSLPSVRYKDGFPYVVVPINTRDATREIELNFTQECSLRKLYATIYQEEGAVPDVHPIWETAELTSNNGNFIEYHITNDGDIIYAGKAYMFPEEFETVWSVNDIVSNYLGNGIYFTEGIQQIPNYAKDFFIGTSANAKYVKTFYNSWAYEHTNYWLSDPIDNRVDPRQWLPVSFLSTEYPYITVGNRVYAAFKENDGWTVMTNLRGLILDCDAGINAIGINNDMFQYQVSKGDYVLYYSNAYGGWDSLLLTGTAKKTDEIEHLTYKRHPRRRSQFSKINYQNNVTPTWNLKTGITIDGNKMFHLLESTMVYLHNLETNEIIPVVITNSQCEYLTYRNNGKRPYFYTITVEESNTKLRK